MWLQNNSSPELIISDIQLLDGTSFEIFSTVKVDCPVIFTTAYDQYAIRAFEVNSIDYLLKPIQLDKLKVALEKAQTQLSKPSTDLNVEELKNLILDSKKEYKSRFLIKVGQKIRAVPVEKIAYFFTKDKLSYVVTFERNKYPLDHTLEEVDGMPGS